MLKIYQMPTSAGSINKGTENAPEVILQEGLLANLRAKNYKYSVLPPISSTHAPSQKTTAKMKNQDLLVDMNKQLYRQITHNSTKNDISLTLGGDHSVVIGSFFATKKLHSNAKVIYIDAHPDANSPTSTPTGNFHAVPLSTALGDGVHGLFELAPFRYADVTMVGLKDVDDYEREYIRKNKLRHYTIDNIIEQGIGKVINEVIEWAGDSPIHIGLDIDSIDEQYAPGTGIKNQGGLTYREVKYVCNKLANLNICAIDLVEVNPKIDVDNKTVHLAIELILNLLGLEWSAYQRYLSQN